MSQVSNQSEAAQHGDKAASEASIERSFLLNSKNDISRRTFVKDTLLVSGAAALSGCGKKTASNNPVPDRPSTSSKSPKSNGKPQPILIGITSDASGQYAASGEMDRRGMLMAIKESNDKGGVLGREIQWIHQDTETQPATGSRVAERMISRDEVNFLIGGISSGVANAISQVAQKYGCIYMNTNSSSPTESGKNAHRVKFVWDGNGTNFAMAIVKNTVKTIGKKWLLLTNDYVWGHNTSKATRELAEAEGAEIQKELLVPQNTRDFSSYLLKIQQARPDVVAVAVGGDDQKALRQQIKDLGIENRPAWINNQQDWPDVYGLPIFGVFGTTWYYNLELPGVKEFVQRYQKENSDARVKVPGNVLYNGYMATRELLGAVDRAGTLKNIAVIKELEQLKVPAANRMQRHDAYMNPKTHQMQQTIYMAAENKKADRKDEFDSYKILSSVSPNEAKDTNSEAEAKLESYEDTPTYEP